MVFNVLIQNCSFFCRSSMLFAVSITWTLRLLTVWFGRLKCLLIYLSCFLFILERCWFKRFFNVLIVAPTYCLLHMEHVIRYIILKEVHVNGCCIRKTCFVLVLLKLVPSRRCEHVAQRGFLHELGVLTWVFFGTMIFCLFSVALCLVIFHKSSSMGFYLLLTNRSLIVLFLNKTNSGVSVNLRRLRVLKLSIIISLIWW